MIAIRKMKNSEVNRISEIDRTEHITQQYRLADGLLESVNVNWHIGPWDAPKKIKEWLPIAEGYENMWGAFDQEILVGFVVYRAHLSEDTAQLAILHVSCSYRKTGIGSRLVEKVFQKARADGKTHIYVTASSTKATTDFYNKLGFELAENVNQDLYNLEPKDIHMIMRL